MLDHGSADNAHKYGTIGAVARDQFGNLAAYTSIGGIVNKRKGRVGDSPIIGAGVYADNATCAVSATRYGEDFMRTVFVKTHGAHQLRPTLGECPVYSRRRLALQLNRLMSVSPAPCRSSSVKIPLKTNTRWIL
jgi:hypothetical protein